MNRSGGHGKESEEGSERALVFLNKKWQRVSHQAQLCQLQLPLTAFPLQQNLAQLPEMESQKMVLLGKAQRLDQNQIKANKIKIPLAFMVQQRLLLSLMCRGSPCDDHQQQRGRHSRHRMGTGLCHWEMPLTPSGSCTQTTKQQK